MFKRALSLAVIICFFLAGLTPYPQAHADTILSLPAPGTMVNLTPAYVPVLVKGLRVHPENPILFDFIVDTGNSSLSANDPRLKIESEKLIKYFLASLTIPEDDLWVNLSPYEKDRMVPDQLGRTEMGRDMLAEDYILKQLTASLIYPEKNLGKEFWNRVYAKAQELYGTSEVPVNTFNKVWIVADKAKVYVHDNTAFVVASHLKVMLEEDYLALSHHVIPAKAGIHSLGSQIVRSIILPQLEQEVNTGKNFANLRQIFHSMILAAWYKKNLKEALLNQVYSNKAKISGIERPQDLSPEQIYQQYLKAYKKGVFNYIKEDIQNGHAVPRKYFSGGVLGKFDLAQTTDPAALSAPEAQFTGNAFLETVETLQASSDAAMNTERQAIIAFYLLREFKVRKASEKKPSRIEFEYPYDTEDDQAEEEQILKDFQKKVSPDWGFNYLITREGNGTNEIWTVGVDEKHRADIVDFLTNKVIDINIKEGSIRLVPRGEYYPIKDVKRILKGNKAVANSGANDLKIISELSSFNGAVSFMERINALSDAAMQTELRKAPQAASFVLSPGENIRLPSVTGNVSIIGGLNEMSNKISVWTHDPGNGLYSQVSIPHAIKLVKKSKGTPVLFFDKEFKKTLLYTPDAAMNTHVPVQHGLFKGLPDAVASLKDRNLTGRWVLLRVNLNVFNDKGEIQDKRRLEEALPILKFLFDRNANVIMVGHSGRFEDGKDSRQSLSPAEGFFRQQFPDVSVRFYPHSIDNAHGLNINFAQFKKDPTKAGQGSLYILDNVRFASDYEQGEKGSPKREEFGRRLALLADMFIFDAFGDFGSDGVSIEDLPRQFVNTGKEIFVGPSMIKEADKFASVAENGIDAVIMGGVKPDKVKLVKDILKTLRDNNFILLGSAPTAKAESDPLIRDIVMDEKGRVVTAVDYSSPNKVDIGPQAIALFKKRLDTLKPGQNVIINGTMGWVEKGHIQGTQEIFSQLGELAEKGVNVIFIGGDANANAVKYLTPHQQELVVLVTGGGVPLKIVAGKTLSGIKAFREALSNEPADAGTDKAALAPQPVGGIDLNARNMGMDISGEKIDIRFDKAAIAQFERGDFSGVRPVILTITPIFNIMSLLGLKEENRRLAGV